MEITIRYGGESLNKHFDGEEVRVSSITSNSSVKAALGFGDNVRVLVDGVEASPESYVSHGEEVDIETRANSKANRMVVMDAIAHLKIATDNLSALIK